MNSCLLKRFRHTILEWNKGANIAQACHAVTKCLITYRDDEFVKQYTASECINEMTKIILSVN